MGKSQSVVPRDLKDLEDERGNLLFEGGLDVRRLQSLPRQ
jgi:hypothetical protein